MGLERAACTAAVGRALQPLPGIADIDVNRHAKMRLELTPDSSLQAGEVIAAVQAGYGAADKKAGDSGVVALLQARRMERTSQDGFGKASSPALRPRPMPGEDEYMGQKAFWPSLVFTLPLMYLTMGIDGLLYPAFTGVEHSAIRPDAHCFLLCPSSTSIAIFSGAALCRSGGAIEHGCVDRGRFGIGISFIASLFSIRWQRVIEFDLAR